MTANPGTDQLLAAIDQGERLAPDNDHLYFDPFIQETVEFAINGSGTLHDEIEGDMAPGAVVIRPMVEPTSERDRWAEKPADASLPGTGRCDRCFDFMSADSAGRYPDEQTRKPLRSVWVNAGRTVVDFHLCDDCVAYLEAVVR